MEKKQGWKSMPVELPNELAGGTYSNLVIVTHSPSEFVVDFARIMPGVEQAQVVSRIVLTPDHAKRLIRAVSENIKHYEYRYGEIELEEEEEKGVSIPTPFTFGGSEPEA